jgi:5-methylcytosine-specific restriction endonuclease McrA
MADGEATPAMGGAPTCCRCGANIDRRNGRGRPRKFCVACSPRKRDLGLPSIRRPNPAPKCSRDLRQCQYCGEGISPHQHAGSPKKYCSPHCRKAQGKLDRKARAERAGDTCSLDGCSMLPRTKGLCETHYRRWRTTGSYERRSKKRQLLARPCRECGEVYTTKIATQEFCSNACALRFGHTHRADYGAALCKRCGAEFTKRSASHALCSKACRDRFFTGNHWHRAKRHGVARERVNRLAVFERDGWICQLCGRTTDARLSGTYEGLAPELDHCIPLALGGPHTYENVQCACRACNNSKGATMWVRGRSRPAPRGV